MYDTHITEITAHVTVSSLFETQHRAMPIVHTPVSTVDVRVGRVP